MAKVLEIATKALQKIGVAASDESLTADEIVNAVDALNLMIHAFKLEGVNLSWVDQAAADTFALANEYHEGIIYLLAAFITRLQRARQLRRRQVVPFYSGCGHYTARFNGSHCPHPPNVKHATRHNVSEPISATG